MTEEETLHTRLKKLDNPLGVRRTKNEEKEVRTILSRLRLLFSMKKLRNEQ